MITSLRYRPLSIVRATRALTPGTDRFLLIATRYLVYIHFVLILTAGNRLKLQFIEVFHFIFHLDVHQTYLFVFHLLPFVQPSTFFVLGWFLVPTPLNQHIVFLLLFITLFNNLIARIILLIVGALDLLLFFSRVPRLVLIDSQRFLVLLDLLRRIKVRQLTYSLSKAKFSLLAFSTTRRYVQVLTFCYEITSLKVQLG